MGKAKKYKKYLIIDEAGKKSKLVELSKLTKKQVKNASLFSTMSGILPEHVSLTASQWVRIQDYLSDTHKITEHEMDKLYDEKGNWKNRKNFTNAQILKMFEKINWYNMKIDTIVSNALRKSQKEMERSK